MEGGTSTSILLNCLIQNIIEDLNQAGDNKNEDKETDLSDIVEENCIGLIQQ